MSDPVGRLCLVLHAHLPFVRHPEHPQFLEEDWLFEAITETYVPILALAERLRDEGVPFRFAMTFSPPLCEMLEDKMLMERYARHLAGRLELIDRERHRGKNPAAVDVYHRLFRQAHDVVERRNGRRLLGAFRALQDSGHLEILTCAATHGFLPNMSRPEAVNAQIAVAVANYRKHFGRPPRGIWLPECGYAPGVDYVLSRHRIDWFVVDSHGVMNGSRVPRRGVFAPIRTPAGVAVFARDRESSKQVWSAKEGYPGDGLYREFYRDLGYDADFDYIKPYLHADGIRRNLGLKYHRITGDIPLHLKEPYDPGAAFAKADEHAGNFVFNRNQQAKWLRAKLGAAPTIVSPYDAELFGHWWFEGPRFLETMARGFAHPSSEVALISPSEVLKIENRLQTLEPSMSTWGDKGYAEVWLNGGNDWMIRHQHRAEDRMVELARRFPAATALERRALTQAARELLLAQSSDWAFLITVGTASPYGHRRFRDHIARFTRLAEGLERGTTDERHLRECEERHNLFQELDYRIYSG
jgi:1,4-alpha-glucan branching enzyme